MEYVKRGRPRSTERRGIAEMALPTVLAESIVLRSFATAKRLREEKQLQKRTRLQERKFQKVGEEAGVVRARRSAKRQR